MALSYSAGRFIGGRIRPEAERVILSTILEVEGWGAWMPVVRVHELVSERLHRAGLGQVSRHAVAARIKAFHRQAEDARLERLRFAHQIPMDVVLVSPDGTPLGRPLITLFGRVAIKEGRVRLRTRIEVSLPSPRSGAARAPDPTPIVENPGTRVKDPRPARRIGKLSAERVRCAAERSGADVECVLDLFTSIGPALPFRRISRALGSGSRARAAVDRLYDAGLLESDASTPFDDDTVFRLTRPAPPWTLS